MEAEEPQSAKHPRPWIAAVRPSQDARPRQGPSCPCPPARPRQGPSCPRPPARPAGSQPWQGDQGRTPHH